MLAKLSCDRFPTFSLTANKSIVAGGKRAVRDEAWSNLKYLLYKNTARQVFEPNFPSESRVGLLLEVSTSE